MMVHMSSSRDPRGSGGTVKQLYDYPSSLLFGRFTSLGFRRVYFAPWDRTRAGGGNAPSFLKAGLTHLHTHTYTHKDWPYKYTHTHTLTHMREQRQG